MLVTIVLCGIPERSARRFAFDPATARWAGLRRSLAQRVDFLRAAGRFWGEPSMFNTIFCMSSRLEIEKYREIRRAGAGNRLSHRTAWGNAPL